MRKDEHPGRKPRIKKTPKAEQAAQDALGDKGWQLDKHIRDWFSQPEGEPTYAQAEEIGLALKLLLLTGVIRTMEKSPEQQAIALIPRFSHEDAPSMLKRLKSAGIEARSERADSRNANIFVKRDDVRKFLLQKTTGAFLDDMDSVRQKVVTGPYEELAERWSERRDSILLSENNIGMLRRYRHILNEDPAFDAPPNPRFSEKIQPKSLNPSDRPPNSNPEPFRG